MDSTFDVHLSNVALDMDMDLLTRTFAPAGKIVKTFIVPRSTDSAFTFGFVRFEEMQAAKKAVALFSRGLVLNGRHISVTISKMTLVRMASIEGTEDVLVPAEMKNVRRNRSIGRRGSKTNREERPLVEDHFCRKEGLYRLMPGEEKVVMEKLRKSLRLLNHDSKLKRLLHIKDDEVKSFELGIRDVLIKLPAVGRGTSSEPYAVEGPVPCPDRIIDLLMGEEPERDAPVDRTCSVDFDLGKAGGLHELRKHIDDVNQLLSKCCTDEPSLRSPLTMIDPPIGTLTMTPLPVCDRNGDSIVPNVHCVLEERHKDDGVCEANNSVEQDELRCGNSAPNYHASGTANGSVMPVLAAGTSENHISATPQREELTSLISAMENVIQDGDGRSRDPSADVSEAHTCRTSDNCVSSTSEMKTCVDPNGRPIVEGIIEHADVRNLHPSEYVSRLDLSETKEPVVPNGTSVDAAFEHAEEAQLCHLHDVSGAHVDSTASDDVSDAFETNKFDVSNGQKVKNVAIEDSGVSKLLLHPSKDADKSVISGGKELHITNDSCDVLSCDAFEMTELDLTGLEDHISMLQIKDADKSAASCGREQLHVTNDSCDVRSCDAFETTELDLTGLKDRISMLDQSDCQLSGTRQSKVAVLQEGFNNEATTTDIGVKNNPDCCRSLVPYDDSESDSSDDRESISYSDEDLLDVRGTESAYCTVDDGNTGECGHLNGVLLQACERTEADGVASGTRALDENLSSRSRPNEAGSQAKMLFMKASQRSAERLQELDVAFERDKLDVSTDEFEQLRHDYEKERHTCWLEFLDEEDSFVRS